MSRKIDLTGQKFGRLTVVKEAGKRDKRGCAYWFCKCFCGNDSVVCGGSLRSNSTKSCGCLRKEQVAKTALKKKKYFTDEERRKARRLAFNKCLNKNPGAHRDLKRKRERKAIVELQDDYVKRVIYNKFRVPFSKIDSKLIQTKRQQLKIFRALKEVRGELNELHPNVRVGF